MKESTKNLFMKHGWRVDRGVHNYIYFVFYYPYVKCVYHVLDFSAGYLSWLKLLNPFLKAAVNRYHSKVLSFSDTNKIFILNEDFRAVSDKNKEIIPFKYAYKIIFQEPEFIAVMDCPCKITLNAPDWSINSCIAVGRGIASFWLDHGRKYNAKKISQGEALDLIRKFRSEGYVTQGFFKVATGGSTGIICNCHPDTCVSLKATKFLKKFNKQLFMNAESGYAVNHNKKKCLLCEDCAKICPVNAISIINNEWVYDKEICFGCELCVEKCDAHALALYRDPEKIVPLDIDLVKKEYL